MITLLPGAAAPQFDVLDVHGQPVRLADGRGRFTLLSFNRFAACPLCNLSIRQLAQHAPAFATRQLRVIAFFESSDANLKQALETWGPMPSYALVGDASAQVYAQYGVPLSAWGTAKSMARVGEMVTSLKVGLPKGVGQDGSRTRMPASFFIGPDLRILQAHVGTDAGDHVSTAQVEQWLESALRSSAPADPGVGARAAG